MFLGESVSIRHDVSFANTKLSDNLCKKQTLCLLQYGEILTFLEAGHSLPPQGPASQR